LLLLAPFLLHLACWFYQQPLEDIHLAPELSGIGTPPAELRL
jgi:hypothetical protein